MYRHTTPNGVTYTSTKSHQVDALGDIQQQCRADGQPVPANLFQIHPSYREKTASAGYLPVGIRAERNLTRDDITRHGGAA